MIRLASLAALIALSGVAPFEFEEITPDHFALMNVGWACCYPAKNTQRGPVVGGYALSLTVPESGHLADPLTLNVEIQNLGAQTQKPPTSSSGVVQLAIAGPGRVVRVTRVTNAFGPVFSTGALPPGDAERIHVEWSEDLSLFPVPGTYALYLSTQLLIAGKPATLRSNSVVVIIFSALPGNQWAPTPTPSPTPFNDAVVMQCGVCEAPSRRTPTGTAVEGIALSLTAPYALARLGARLPVIVELRNVSREVKYVFFGFRNAQYDFEVRNVRTGKVVPVDPGSRLVTITRIPTTEAVPPGQSLFGLIDVNHIYPIKEPGMYSIRVTRGQPALQPGHSGPWTRLELNSPPVLVRVVAPPYLNVGR